jgi:hypothetical protein
VDDQFGPSTRNLPAADLRSNARQYPKIGSAKSAHQHKSNPILPQLNLDGGGDVDAGEDLRGVRNYNTAVGNQQNKNKGTRQDRDNNGRVPEV